MLNPINKTIELGDGRTITIETGKLAKQADGAVTVRMNNTVLLATVCAAKDANPGVDFMPLQVEYKEKYSAFGRFPGGFTKREGKASDYEILTSRLVDRALRPLFPDNYHAEVYVNIILFSADVDISFLQFCGSWVDDVFSIRTSYANLRDRSVKRNIRNCQSGGSGQTC